MNKKMLEDICGTDLFGSVVKTLSDSLFAADGKYKEVLKLIEPLYQAVQSVALMLIFIYFMIAVIDKLSGENFTWEQLWRQMALLLVSMYLINHGFDLLELLFDLGMALLSKVAAVIPEGGGVLGVESAEALLKEFEDSLGLSGVAKILKSVIIFVWLLIPWALSWVMGLCVKIILYSRVIEIYVRTVFAPIALADFYQGGLQSAGFRYLRNFLAVAIQGSIILVIAAIYSALFTTVVSSAGLNIFAFLGLYLAFLASAIMLMFKSLSVAKELVGTA